MSTDRNITMSGARIIGGTPLFLLMVINGDSGVDLLDAVINYVTALAANVG